MLIVGIFGNSQIKTDVLFDGEPWVIDMDSVA